MKRITAIFLCIAVAVSVSACSAGRMGSPDSSVTASSSVPSDGTDFPDPGGFDTDITDVSSVSSSSGYYVFSEIEAGETTDGGTEDPPSDGPGSPEEAPENPEEPSDTPSPETPSTSVETPSGTSGVTGKVYDSSLSHRFLATDIRNHSIVVFDLNACGGDFEDLTKDSVGVVWEWDADEDPNCKINPGEGIDAAKYRYSPYYKKDVIIACSSTGWAGVIDYEKRTVLWEYRIGDGPHSIELLPGSGDIVVGCSSGSTTGKLAYVPLSAGITSPTCVISVPSCHGVSWDPQQNVLWVLEYSQIFSCAVSEEGTPSAELIPVEGSEVSFAGKDASGHALTPVYGEPGFYWVSAGSYLWKFDSKNGSLTRDFEGAGVYSSTHIKGIAGFADGTVVESIAQSGGNTTYNWSCGGFRIILWERRSGGMGSAPVIREVYFSQREFYKVHPFTKDYQ